MALVTGWVQRPKYKKGLDPLGVQQPCIAVYSALLPGITNVTDRIIYFGFGPWFVWSYAQRYTKTTASNFIDMLRRAEVLLTLIGVRHAIVSDDGLPDQHDGALVGVDTLRKVVVNARANAVIQLSQYATLDDVDERYFKNRRGGLGQYYLGPSRDEYQLLGEREGRVIDFTIERGQPMAQSVAAGVDSEKFFQCLEEDRASIRDLDSLSAFCPCQLRTKGRTSERTLLLDTVVGLQTGLSRNAETRRRSLELLIDFLKTSDGCEAPDGAEDTFLVGCYARVLPSGKRWSPPACLAGAADVWAFYLRGELLSLAMQRLFREALLTIDSHDPKVLTVEAAGRWCASMDPFRKVIQAKGTTYNGLLASTRLGLPQLGNVEHKCHEIALWEAVLNGAAGSLATVDAAVGLILSLLARHQGGSFTIARAIGANPIRLENYPINLDTVFGRAQTRWPGMTMADWMVDILCWILGAHRQVALRKLSQSGDDTRRLRMGEDTLYVDGDIIEVARTVPRLRQALRFLEDLGLTSRGHPGRLPIPTRHALNVIQQSHAI